MSRRRDKCYSSRRWFKLYRQRIVDGLETCRNCGVGDDERNWLTFDHVIPSALGRNMTFDNATILCEDCNSDKADQVWPHLISLAAEEAQAPRERRWFLLADIEQYRRSNGGFAGFVRRGLDGSEVAIAHADMPWGVRCLVCALRGDGEHEEFGHDFVAVLRHIDAHRVAGHRVPVWVDLDVMAADAQQKGRAS